MMLTATASVLSGVPIEDYLAHDAASSSRLRNIGRSPAYCRWSIDNRGETTPAQAVGLLADALLTEADKVGSGFARAEACAATKKDGTPCGNGGSHHLDGLWYCGVRGHAPVGAGPFPGVVLSDSDYRRAQDIAAAIERHPFWRSLEDVRFQQTVYVDGNPGRKARPDILASYGGGVAVVDIKVCRHASQDVYPRACWGLWHAQQLAWDIECLRPAGVRVASAWILAAHPQAPHEVTAYMMSDAMLAQAREVVLKREERYADCVASGVWPDGEEVVVVEPPEWVMPSDVIVEEDSDE